MMYESDVPNTGQQNMVKFAIRAYTTVFTAKMYHDFERGSYELVGDKATEFVMQRIGWQESLPARINFNLFPMMRGVPISWDEVMITEKRNKHSGLIIPSDVNF
jgi:hypothetical protein